MRRFLTLPLAALALALPLALPLAAAADAPMTAAEFEAYVTGKTLTYAQSGTVYGTEEYLPNRRVRWQVAEDCQYGRWFERDGLICFAYEYDTADHCWTFWRDETGLKALSVDDLPGEELSEVRQTADGLDCPAPDVGV